MDTSQAVQLLGEALIAEWSKLSQADQERLFEAAVGSSPEDDRLALAKYLHDRHPKTAHASTHA